MHPLRFHPTLETLERRDLPSGFGIGDALAVPVNRDARGIGDAVTVPANPDAKGIGDAVTVRINPADGRPDRLAQDPVAPRDVPIQLDDESVPVVVAARPTVIAPPAVAPVLKLVGPTVVIPLSLLPLNNVPPLALPAYRVRTDLFGFPPAAEPWVAKSSPAVRQAQAEKVEPPMLPPEEQRSDFQAAADEVFAAFDAPAAVETARPVEAVPDAVPLPRATKAEALPLLAVMVGCLALAALRAERARVRRWWRECRDSFGALTRKRAGLLLPGARVVV